jgi:hypothetical protein
MREKHLYTTFSGNALVISPKKRLPMQRRGQAALEFLSTYGFAFLIILVMIGALTYFGILSPGKFIPGSCLISPEFKCKDRQISYAAGSTNNMEVRLAIINQLGNSVTLSMVNSEAESAGFGNGTCQVSSAGTPTPATQVVVVGGESATVNCTMISSIGWPARGEKLRSAVDFKYKELGGNFDHPVRAEVVETIQ